MVTNGTLCIGNSCAILANQQLHGGSKLLVP